VEGVVRDIFGAWDDYRQNPDEFRELDDERVLVVYRRSGRGKMSGMEITELGRGAVLFHIRDGKVTRMGGRMNVKGSGRFFLLSARAVSGAGDDELKSRF
jgi:hypothetical protein